MIKKYKSFLESKQDIHSICKRYNITNYTINKDGSIDVDGDVNLNEKKLTELPLNFNLVTGDFFCHVNQLKTLERAPKLISGSFYCGDNKLTTLEYAPKSIGGYFDCSYNQLTTLEGAPKSVGGDFYCHQNQLTSLKGAPKSIGGNFSCFNNKLTTLKGAPKSVYGDFNFGDKIDNIWKLFKDKDKIELFNDYDMIIDDYESSGKPAVILDRLNSFLLDIDKEEVKKVEGYINI